MKVSLTANLTTPATRTTAEPKSAQAISSDIYLPAPSEQEKESFWQSRGGCAVGNFLAGAVPLVGTIPNFKHVFEIADGSLRNLQAPRLARRSLGFAAGVLSFCGAGANVAAISVDTHLGFTTRLALCGASALAAGLVGGLCQEGPFWRANRPNSPFVKPEYWPEHGNIADNGD
jgi:hypothetical protein